MTSHTLGKTHIFVTSEFSEMDTPGLRQYSDEVQKPLVLVNFRLKTEGAWDYSNLESINRG